MNTNTDPREILNNSAMGPLQITVIALTIFLNALDGFDVLSISFASPGIAAAWGIDRGALGIVLSMELIGMAIGSIFLGRVADKIGRRPMLLGCLVVMALGMFLATTSNNAVQLSIWRVLTGLGIGGMLACTNAVTAEFASTKRRHLCISLMVIGYPLGGVFGGMIASDLLATYDWQAVFYFGAIVTALMIPLVYFLVPESVQWLASKQPEGALERINQGMKRMGHMVVSALPDITKEDSQKVVASIFSPAIIGITLMITAAYFFHITTFYFILKWTPKIVADMGFTPSLAGDVLVWANVGGALGGAVVGFLTIKFDLKKITIVILLLSALGVALFGRTPADLDRMSMLAAIAGFFGNAGVTGLYALLAAAFPASLRATGTGFVIGMGRAGAVLSPILAGFLLESGAGLPAVGIVMGSGSLIAAVVLIFLKLQGSNNAQESAA